MFLRSTIRRKDGKEHRYWSVVLFDHLVGRWRDLFNASFDVLLYDLTSTYFEANPPFPDADKRRFGYSRDKRSDCVQVVIALIVTLWTYYLQLVAVEEAFKNLKGDLAIRPIFHQREARIEAHIFVAFLAYCLHVTLKRRLAALAPGLTPRSVLEKFSTVQMIDVIVPTADGRELQLTRTTQPDPDIKLLLDKLRLELPAQPPPKISIPSALAPAHM